jgi:hypothetical protein
VALPEISAVISDLPVVYVGPTLHADDVRRWLPRCQPMPPVRRGDLYRDRLLGFRTFVILDGVFAQELAISPREVVDIAGDGGLVVGACSMGAMRAAECWPVGVEGVGSVYRLFRRGLLTSDAEVAVAFSPVFPYQPLSIPLVNVRYALSRGIRGGVLSDSIAARMLKCASDIFFGDRTWDLVLRMASVPDPSGSLKTSLQQYDLKRLDAIRALCTVQRRIARRARLGHEGGAGIRQRVGFARSREQAHAVDGSGPAGMSIDDLWRWLVATGRYRRFAAAALAIHALPRTSKVSVRARAHRGNADTQTRALPHTESAWMTRLGLHARDLEAATGRARTTVRTAGLLTTPDTPLARMIWADLTVAGERDALVFAFTAVTRAIRFAQRANLTGQRVHRHAAMSHIAHAHGFATWSALQQELGASALWAWIEQALEDTTLAKRVRQELFTNAGHSAGGLESVIEE